MVPYHHFISVFHFTPHSIKRYIKAPFEIPYICFCVRHTDRNTTINYMASKVTTKNNTCILYVLTSKEIYLRCVVVADIITILPYTFVYHWEFRTAVYCYRSEPKDTRQWHAMQNNTYIHSNFT